MIQDDLNRMREALNNYTDASTRQAYYLAVFKHDKSINVRAKLIICAEINNLFETQNKKELN